MYAKFNLSKSKEGFDMTLNLHNSESLVIIYEMNKDYDGGRLSASKGNHGVAGKSSVF